MACEPVHANVRGQSIVGVVVYCSGPVVVLGVAVCCGGSGRGHVLQRFGARLYVAAVRGAAACCSGSGRGLVLQRFGTRLRVAAVRGAAVCCSCSGRGLVLQWFWTRPRRCCCPGRCCESGSCLPPEQIDNAVPLADHTPLTDDPSAFIPLVSNVFLTNKAGHNYMAVGKWTVTVKK